MNWKLLLVLLANSLLRPSISPAQSTPAMYKEVLAALESQPLVVLLRDESPQELQKLAKRPTDLAQYKASVALYNSQVQQLIPKIWTLSPAIEFKSEEELEAFKKNKQQATLVLMYTQQRLGSLDNMNHTWGGTYSDTKWLLALMGGRRAVWSLSTVMPPRSVAAYDIVSGLRNLQLKVKAARATPPLDERAERQEYSQRLRTKTLLIDQTGLPEGLTESELRKIYPYPFQLVTVPEIETAVLAADPHYAYVGNLSNTARIVDTADGAHLAAVVTEGDPQWGKDVFKLFAKQVK
ncbi:hypothetical protein Q5H93_21900 [Hymenobacter sp. ASUV-10]|uniref:DUF4252 domain-containing protein n=1 Tax=Hymenobacter aranciens TaxID=3063996 RepID=A0ABT9BGL9_9BACT|nr:hypothetical protein [Hymenobacter sp. ASUV-10]MDO7877410.1 hypothetical protein [Hymenobacter sp. ASUV-10]